MIFKKVVGGKKKKARHEFVEDMIILLSRTRIREARRIKAIPTTPMGCALIVILFHHAPIALLKSTLSSGMGGIGVKTRLTELR